MVNEMYLWEAKFSYRLIVGNEVELKVVTMERSFAEAEKVALEAIKVWEEDNFTNDKPNYLTLESIKPLGIAYKRLQAIE